MKKEKVADHFDRGAMAFYFLDFCVNMTHDFRTHACPASPNFMAWPSYYGVGSMK